MQKKLEGVKVLHSKLETRVSSSAYKAKVTDEQRAKDTGSLEEKEKEIGVIEASISELHGVLERL